MVLAVPGTFSLKNVKSELTACKHESKVRRPMKTYRNNLLHSDAEARNTLPHATNSCDFFDRDLEWSNDHGPARPEEMNGHGGATGVLIR